jgi:hypothetical protein
MVNGKQLTVHSLLFTEMGRTEKEMRMKLIAGMMVACFAALAARAGGWTPGGEYGPGAAAPNAVYDPFSRYLPINQNVTVVGRIASNQVAVFTDNSGRRVRGVTLEDMGAGTNGAAAVAQEALTTSTNALAIANTKAPLSLTVTVQGRGGSLGTNLTWTLTAADVGAVPAPATNGWVVAPHLAWLTNETDQIATGQLVTYTNQNNASMAALYALIMTNRVDRLYERAGGNAWYTADSNVVTRWSTSVVTADMVVVSEDFQGALGERPTLRRAPFDSPIDFGNGFVFNVVYGGFSMTLAGSFHWSGGWVSVEPEILFPSTLTIVPGDGVGSVYVGPYPVVQTNTVFYYLSTNPVLPETWGSADMINWMADGEAGQLWVSSLSADSANSVLNGHTGAIDPHPGKYAPAASTNAPAWSVYTNIVAAVTLTNQYERPFNLVGTGGGTGIVSFAGMRPPAAVYLEASGFVDLRFSGAYIVGGGSWQTNQVNIFVAWQSGTNIFVTPITTRSR